MKGTSAARLHLANTASRAAPQPIEAVLFDFHATLVDAGDGAAWVELAWRQAGRAGDHVDFLGPGKSRDLAHRLGLLWETARDLDPESARDLDPGSHRKVFDRLIADLPDIDATLAQALYETLMDAWSPYEDTLPVLSALHARGIRTALVSNIALNVRPILSRAGLTDLLDAVVLSFEIGAIKPETRIFMEALDRIGVPPERALMVGDSWRDDGGAAQLGVRTLILPRTNGPIHGLELVLRLVAE